MFFLIFSRMLIWVSSRAWPKNFLDGITGFTEMFFVGSLIRVNHVNPVKFCRLLIFSLCPLCPLWPL